MESRKKNIIKETSTNSEVFDYNKYIKFKLVEWRASFEEAISARLNYSAIAKRMQLEFGIQTSAQKISAMFDTQSSREVKLQELAALAQLFNIPVWDICAFPNAPSTNIDITPLVIPNKKEPIRYSQLTNRFYSGTYYCYYFRPKHFAERLMPVSEYTIDEAKLTISIKNGHTIVKLSEMRASTTFYGEPMPSFTLTGNLYHFTNTDIAYSFLTNADGRRAMALMFTYLNLSADIRYYMTVAMMTFSQNQTHNPLFQKMAVFRVRQNYQNAETANTLRGILSLNTSPIIIDEETLTQITTQDASLGKLVSPDKALKKCYVFSEASIRSDAYFLYDEDQKTQKMLELRKNSMLPAHEIVSEPDYFADFIKHYQQMQLHEQQQNNFQK